jgi:hypothetical protein
MPWASSLLPCIIVMAARTATGQDCRQGCDYTNTYYGDRALESLQDNIFGNTALGAGALAGDSTGAENTAIGEFALQSNTVGSGNTALGGSALTFSTTGSYNTATGQVALSHVSSGGFNTATGAKRRMQ